MNSVGLSRIQNTAFCINRVIIVVFSNDKFLKKLVSKQDCWWYFDTKQFIDKIFQLGPFVAGETVQFDAPGWVDSVNIARSC